MDALDRAKAELVWASARLITEIAKTHTQHGLEFLELIEEGRIGLVRAVDTFDHPFAVAGEIKALVRIAVAMLADVFVLDGSAGPHTVTTVAETRFDRAVLADAEQAIAYGLVPLNEFLEHAHASIVRAMTLGITTREAAARASGSAIVAHERPAEDREALARYVELISAADDKVQS